MIRITATQDAFKINDVRFDFPIDIQKLKEVLGEARFTSTKFNQIYTWDDLGILGYSKKGKLIETLSLSMSLKEYKFMPKQIFTGEITFNSEDTIKYYTENKSKRIKLFKGDKIGAIVVNDICFWFDVEDHKIEAIEIKKHQLEEMVTPDPLPVDEEYKYLQPLWAEWIEELGKIVPSDNDYYNLDHGITADDIKKHAQLDEEVRVPDELINFYKIHNVAYDAVTSAFSFSPDGWGGYDLIPFQDIKQEWEDIQCLQFGADLDAESLSAYSEMVKADDYTNPRWIPFATGRNGDYLLYDTDPSPKGTYGQIVELQNESWTREVVAKSLQALIQHEIGLLKSGQISKYDFILSK